MYNLSETDSRTINTYHVIIKKNLYDAFYVFYLLTGSLVFSLLIQINLESLLHKVA